MNPVVFIFEHHPFLTYTIVYIVIQCAIEEIIEERLHTACMGSIDVSLHGSTITVAGYDVRPYFHRLCSRTAQRMMVFPMPILKLHVVDMIAVEVIHDCCYFGRRHFAVHTEKSITRKARRFGRHIYTD